METNITEQSWQNEPKRLSASDEILLRLKQDKKTSRRIAEMYAKKNPREVLYAVLLCSVDDDDDSEGTFYFSFTDEEKAKLADYLNRPEDEQDVPLNEYLDKEMTDKLESDINGQK